MHANPSEEAILDASELAHRCGISVEELDELLDYGVLGALVQRDSQVRCRVESIWPLREAARQRAIFDLDLFTMGLLAGYLQRIEGLERQLRTARAVLPHLEGGRDGPAGWHEPHA